MKKATKQQFLREVAKHPGVKWEFTLDDALVVDAPPGMVFADADTHSVAATVDCCLTRGDQYASAIEDLRGGFIPCTDPHCPVCDDDPESESM